MASDQRHDVTYLNERTTKHEKQKNYEKNQFVYVNWKTLQVSE